MNQLLSLPLRFFAALFMASILFGCAQNTSVNSKYDIASTEYEALTEKYLQHLANFELEDSYAMLSDDVQFKLPDGDTDTRTTFKGLEEVKSFWESYQEKSGNDKAAFTNFVHIPVQVNEIVEHVGVTGVFNLCYFSAALSYGSEVANVRMHWAFHFNDAKKIDGIYTYYDRTPIIQAAKKNFLAKSGERTGQSNKMVVQIIKLKSELSEEDLLKKARERAPRFAALPGLIQKYYVRLGQPGQYSGIYIWDSMESLQAYKASDLASSIPQAYKTVGAPEVEISDLLFQLRD